MRNSRVKQPVLSPSDQYEYLRFISSPRDSFIEVYLPNDESYIVDWKELDIFLKRSMVENYKRLMDFIWNFGCVLWNRCRNTYFAAHRDELLTREQVEEMKDPMWSE